MVNRIQRSLFSEKNTKINKPHALIAVNTVLKRFDYNCLCNIYQQYQLGTGGINKCLWSSAITRVVRVCGS